jgi:hypothetical protein
MKVQEVIKAQLALRGRSNGRGCGWPSTAAAHAHGTWLRRARAAGRERRTAVPRHSLKRGPRGAVAGRPGRGGRGRRARTRSRGTARHFSLNAAAGAALAARPARARAAAARTLSRSAAFGHCLLKEPHRAFSAALRPGGTASVSEPYRDRHRHRGSQSGFSRIPPAGLSGVERWLDNRSAIVIYDS